MSAALRNELLKLFARKRTYIGFGAFVVVQCAILFLLQLPKAKRAFRQLLENMSYAFDDYYSGLTLAVLIIMFTVALLGVLYLALVAGDVVSKEVEDGTMRMILSRPISRLRLLWVKWVACALYTFVLILFIGLTSLAAGVIYRGGLGKLFVFAPLEQLFAVFGTGEGLWRYWRAICFLGLSLQVVSGMAFMFSCFNMKPAAATIVTLSVMFLDFVLHNIPYFVSIKKWFISYHTACWLRTFQPEVMWWGIAESVLYLAALTLSFWVIGAMYFCARDFKA